MFQHDEQAMRATIAVRTRFALERIKQNAADWSAAKLDAAKKELAAIERDLERLQQGGSLLAANCELLMGYRSELDDSEQPYSLWIPEEYDGKAALPLVVLLHGQGMFNPLQCHATPIGQMIVVAPQGRGGMDYQYVGEGDVLRVIDEVCRLLRVDSERVYLAGSSMGGAGAFHLASKFPDRFAGIMACCGNTDINVWAQLWHWRTPENSPQANLRQFLREDTSSATYAANLFNVPVLALQGENDPVVNQLHAARMREALQACAHPRFTFHMLPLVMHGFTADYEAGLKDMRRIACPTRLHYKTAWLKYPGAYWVRVTALQQRLRHASIDASADMQQQSIAIQTQNVAELEIDPKKLPFEGATSVVLLDQQRLSIPEKHAGTVKFQLGQAGWKLAALTPTSAPATFPPRKNERIEGPLEHAFMSRFLIVAGSDEKDADAGELERAIRAAAQAYVEQWKTRFSVPCRRKSVREVTQQDIADSNLILIGTPEQNALLARILPQLPLSFEPQGIRLGGTLYAGPATGVMLCYPNPLNPERYVGIIAGTSPQSYRDVHVRFGNWFDWVPYDYRKHFDFAIFDDLSDGRNPESFLVWGFFDEDWKCADSLTFAAVPAWRKKLRPRVLPQFDPADKRAKYKPPPTVFLDQLAPLQASYAKEYLERNRSLDGRVLQLQGRSYERGLCCRFPCALTFNTEGYKRLRLSAGVEWDGISEPCEDRKKFEKAKITVTGDAGRLLFEAKDRTYKSEPVIIDIELEGSESVTLSVSGGRSWLNGSFIFADARLEKDPANSKSK